MDEKYKVVPNSLNYGDIKPESIQTDIRLTKFVPTATITNVRKGDQIKFLLQGQGFLDPYSSFFEFEVEVPDMIDNEIRFLDRSAHSFIQSIIIRSQGVELERLDQYDVMAAMINDMIYSPEQNAIHGWEGFPTQQVPFQTNTSTVNEWVNAYYGGFDATHQALVGNPIAAGTAYHRLTKANSRKLATQLLYQGSTPAISKYVGEVAFFNEFSLNNTQAQRTLINGGVLNNSELLVQDFPHIYDQYIASTRSINPFAGVNPTYDVYQDSQDTLSSLHPVEYSYHQNGLRKTGVRVNGIRMTWTGVNRMKFIIPIYSSVIGLMMPEKKLIPLGLLPLDIEVKFNEFALYSSNSLGSRNYIITKFNIFANTVFFESEIHKQIEAQTAERGLFIYCNNFHLGPLYFIGTESLPEAVQIPMNLKSVNSVHFVFMYTQFRTRNTARKLHFVSHNLKRLQILNGATYRYPAQEIEGDAGTSLNNQHIPFLVETLKAYNKMHDPKTDAAIHPYNFCGDTHANQMDAIPYQTTHLANESVSSYFLQTLLNAQGNVGRCQYGVALDGEELGTDKQLITGRKIEFPFHIAFGNGTKKSVNVDSQLVPFFRCDFIIYIRPDLQIVTLGK